MLDVKLLEFVKGDQVIAINVVMILKGSLVGGGGGFLKYITFMNGH